MRRRRLSGGTWLSVIGLLLLSAAEPATAGSVPPGFTDVTVSRSDGRSWDEAAGAIVDSGRIFVWERGGRVWLIDPDQPRSTPLLDLSDEVTTVGSLGLTGFALDPLFATSSFERLQTTTIEVHRLWTTRAAACSWAT